MTELKYILHVCGSFKPGGISAFVKSIIELNDKGNSVHDLMLIFACEKGIFQNKCVLHYLNYNEDKFVSCLRKVGQIYNKYDAIMIHSAHPVIVFPLILAKKQCFLFQHGMAVSSGFILKRTIKKLWYSLIPILLNARIICSTEFAFNKARKLGILLQRKRCVNIPFGIKMDKKNGKIRNLNGKSVIKIGTAGRLVLQKRIDLLLKSLSCYTGKTKLHCKIAGDGPELQNLKELAKLVKNINVKIDFLGHIENMEVFYNGIDLFVFPSGGESFGLVVLEALTRFIPVVVFSDVGGCKPLIENKKNGFVLRAGSDGLISLWNELDRNVNVINKQSAFIAEMDLSRYDIQNTRVELENLVSKVDDS